MRLIFTCFILLIVTGSYLRAQYSARESFEYPVGTSFDTLIGTIENGWDGPWDLYEGMPNATIIADTGFHPENLNYPVPQVGNHLIGRINNSGDWCRFVRPLDQLWSDQAGAVYWLSVLMEIKNDTSTSSWIGIKLGPSPPNIEFPIMIGKGWGMNVFTIGSGYHAGPSEETSTTSWDVGPVWLVAKIVMSGNGQNERAYLWITPDPNGVEPDTNNADARASVGLNSGFKYVKIEYGGVPIDMEVVYDEVRLVTSFNGLTGVRPVKYRVPDKYSLSQNYPNPFNPTTNICFAIPEAELVNITVYNSIGQEVAEILNEYKYGGTYNVDFNAAGLQSGVYFYRIKSGNYSETKKMIFLK